MAVSPVKQFVGNFEMEGFAKGFVQNNSVLHADNFFKKNVHLMNIIIQPTNLWMIFLNNKSFRHWQTTVEIPFFM